MVVYDLKKFDQQVMRVSGRRTESVSAPGAPRLGERRTLGGVTLPAFPPPS